MKRYTVTHSFAAEKINEVKRKMLNWANRFSILLYLDSNGYADRYGSYECLLAAGATSMTRAADAAALGELDVLQHRHKDWLFGHICYDYKNVLEPRLHSRHEARIHFPLIRFFVPDTVCYIPRGSHELVVSTAADHAADILQEILQVTLPAAIPLPQLRFIQRQQKEDDIHTIERLRTHIAAGDCYEINYCCEAYCEQAEIDPLQVFQQLNAASPAPFAAYYRSGSQYLLCASPERYLRKQADKIIAQPIKGTARRGTDAAADEKLKAGLQQNIKERAENVMIVDLMRNDLARSCDAGTVQVEELFGIYTFPTVHQMISTVSGRLRQDKRLADVLRYAFPMGSMTGAPKIKVMELTDQYETAARGLFSGTLGYISPGGDADFNVVIRSLFYNEATQYLSYQTGGAITYDSDPAQEWEERLLKAWALERLFR